MTSEAPNRASKLVDELYEKHGSNLEALFKEFEERVIADPSLKDELVAPAFERIVKMELLKRGRLPH
jgi:hypothetical protein